MSKVLIIIPTYQHSQFISECLDSLISQTYKDWEAIIIDDGSYDGTGKICKEYVHLDNRIQYHFQENKGILKLNEIFNHALSLSNSEFVAVLEGDDYWPSNKLEEQLRGFESENIGLVWGNGKVLINDKLFDLKGYCGNFKKSTLSNSPIGINLKALAFSRYFIMPTTSVMYRRNALENIGGFYQPKNCSWNDRSTWAVLACSTNFKYLDKNLGIYRRHPAQVTNNWTDINTTFDYIIHDEDCPDILKKEIKKIYGELRIMLSYHKFNRSIGFKKSRYLLEMFFTCLKDIPSILRLILYTIQK